MPKRLNTSQSNTLLNYFQSPKANKITPKPVETTPKPTPQDEIEMEQERSEEIIKPPPTEGLVKISTPCVGVEKRLYSARKRIRPAIQDSDSDTENLETPKKVTNKLKMEDLTPERPVKAIKLKFTPNNSKPKSDEKKSGGEGKWLHETLDFLKPDMIQDANKRKPTDPDYDERTLFVPNSYMSDLTPALKQWWVLKSQHMDCVLFFKVGKFYELYHMDACVGVKYLGVSYMKGDFAHSGFPESSYGRMVATLMEHGFKVARVEQTETPAMMAKRLKKIKATKFKVVKREICQISTKGACLYGAQLMDANQSLPCYMIAIAEKIKNNTKRLGVCFIDTSIGIIHISEFEDDSHCSRLLALISQHPPALLLTERGRLSPETNELMHKSLVNIRRETLFPNTQFYTAATVFQNLHSGNYFKDENDEVIIPKVLENLFVDGAVKSEYELAVRSLGACMWYLKDAKIDVQVLSMGKIEIYHPVDTLKNSKLLNRDYMILDAITMKNLNILGGVGSLQKTLDHCCTAFGKRLLQQWICRPLCDVVKIVERQDAVAELVDNPDLLRSYRELLSKLPDLERQVAKIHGFGNKFCATDHPDSRAIFHEAKTYAKRKINDLIKTLGGFKLVNTIPRISKNCKSLILTKITSNKPNGKFIDLSDTLTFFENAFDHKQAKEEGTIAPPSGIDDEYDMVQDGIKQINNELDDYLGKQRKFFGCQVTYFGSDKKRFQLDVPATHAGKVTLDYQLEGIKRGAKPSRRYSTATSRALLLKLITAEAYRTKVVNDLNRKIFKKFSDRYEEWNQVIHCVMILDCLCSLAEYARTYSDDICIPKVLPFSDNPISRIKNGRHPCINVANFIPNDTEFGTKDNPNILILTGPNMGGKSTLMRQVLLINIMAQIGGFVPASFCELSLIDRIFTRLGAYDNIFKNQSTFLVELMEASSILQHATKNSFLLMDEFGRGTSTHDGNAVATAYVQKLCEINCRTMFSTHYHSLVEHYSNTSAVQLAFMECMVENDGDVEKEIVTFLYKLASGVCPKSYGFNVARLAGVQPVIVKRAHEVATGIELVSNHRNVIMALTHNGVDEIRNVLRSLTI